MSTRCPLHFQFKIFPLSLIISSLTHPPLILFSDDSEVVAVNIKEEDLESDQDLKNVIGRVGVGDTSGSNGDGAEEGGEDGKRVSSFLSLTRYRSVPHPACILLAYCATLMLPFYLLSPFILYI